MFSYHLLEPALSYNNSFVQIAAPCGPQNYEKLRVAEMDCYLDFWNLMAYDYGETSVPSLDVLFWFKPLL